MNKRNIFIALILLLLFGTISMYNTFAYNEEDISLDNSTANYNLIYSLKDKSSKIVTLSARENKYLEINLENPYQSSVRYGMYYYVLNDNSNRDKLSITLDSDSKDPLEDIILPEKSKSILLKLENNSDYPIEVQVGALVGFVNGKIDELVKDGEVLIK